jgi:external thioesterase TEII
MKNKTLLIALPFAGGNSYSYNFLKPLLPKNIILETLEYPGRGKKSKNSFITQMNELNEDLLAQYYAVVGAVWPAKIFFYGHSIGAVIGLSLLHTINEKCPEIAPEMAIFSGHGSPQKTAKKKLSILTDDQLVQYFQSIGSLSKTIAADKELMEYILPILRNDLKLYENYNAHYPEKLTIPLAIINGKDDNILQRDIDMWAQETTGKTKIYQLDGHHFFISQYPLVFSNLIVDLVKEREKTISYETIH